MNQQFLDEMKQKLEEEKEKLSAEILSVPVHTEMGNDDDDLAAELPVDQVNQDLRARIESDIVKIDKALAKIEAGTFGTDDDGVAIAEERLRVLPWADKAI